MVGWIILGVIAFLLLVAGIAGFYFYNFYVFKEIRACVEEGEDLKIPCENRQICLDLMIENGADFDAVNGAPDFVRENFEAILNEAIYCENTCFVGKVRGIDYESGDLLELESCEEGEAEFVMEIRGKEGLEILNWMKGMKEQI